MTERNNWNRKMEIALHIVIWLFFLLAYGLVFAQFMPMKISFARGVVNVLPMVIIFYVTLWMVNQYLEKKKYWPFTLIALFLFTIATIFRAEVNTYFPYVLKESPFIEKKQNWFLAALFTNFCIMVVGVLYQMLYNRYDAEKRNLAIINEQREAQLQALRAQINPHFLFNTLNNIYALAVGESKQTADMVLKLSKLLRYVIYDGLEKKVSLKKEVEHIEEFIGLFQMRMEEPANVRFNYSGVAENQLVEPMILIPFLENGFKHGDFDTNPNAFLKADLSVENDTLDFRVINSKNDQDRQKDRQGGVGLENIKKRLALKYNGQYQLDIQDQQDQFFVQFKLQLTHGKHKNTPGG